MTPDDEKQKHALKWLINFAMVEALMFATVVWIYFLTDSLVFLVGGILGAVLITLPFLIRWIFANNRRLKDRTDSTGEDL